MLNDTRLSALRPEYEQLFANCKIRRNWVERIGQVTQTILTNRDRYDRVAKVVNPLMPWYVVGLLHSLETNFDWRSHLHNGDPLTNRTVRYPPGRPQKEPFNGWAIGYTWEESVVDALCSMGFDRAKQWDLPGGILWHLECYNGMQYRASGLYSPYLWSGTNWYHKGKYESATQYNPEFVFERVGAATVLFYMYYRNLLSQEQTQAVAWTTATAAPNAMSVGSGARSDRTSVATLAPPTPAVPVSSSVGKLTIKNPTGQGTYLKQSMAQSNILPDSQKRWANNNSELPLLHWSTVNDHYAIVLNGSLDGLQKWFVYKNHVTIEPLGQPLQQNTPGNPPVQSLPMLQRSPSNSVVEVAKPPASVTNSLYGGASGKVPLPAIAIVKQFEGCYLKAYPDPLTGGKPITIGWGCTRKKDGSEWSLGERITQEEADDLLIYQLDRDYLPPLEKIPVWNELNVNQKAALLSFAYNLGARFYGSNNFQSMTRVLANKQWDEIESTFLKYRNPGSNVEAGLKRRRLAEAKLFLTPPASTEVSNPPSAPLQKFATATPAFVPSQSFATAAPSASSIPTNGSDNYLWVQQQLIRLCILDPPADGKWGKQSKAALASFQQLKGLANTGEIDSATLAALGSTQELIPLKLGTDFASSLTQYMMKKGYFVPRGDRRYSIVYVHSLNEQFQPTPSTPDAWDDRRMILEIPNNGVPRIVNHWTATCDPGLAPTQRSRIAGGVAQVAFGQYQAWQHGFHGYGKRYPPYPSLVQAGPVDIMRDTNRNYRRDSGDTLIQKSTGNGINQHHGWNASEVGFNSEGCLVGKNVEGHHEFIDLCKQDVRYQVNPGYTYFTTVIEGADIFKT